MARKAIISRLVPPADLDFTIENLPPGSTIDIVVTAVNNGGESLVSEVVTVTTHA